MAFTLADIKVWLRDRDRDSASAQAARMYGRVANDANRALRELAWWTFDRKLARLVLAARANAGTVSVDAGGTTVTGVGTAFAAADVGKFIRFAGERLQYLVTARAGATEITIEAYRGTTALSGAAYSLEQPRVALDALFRRGDVLLESDSGLDCVWIPQDDMLWWRRECRETSQARLASVEWYTSSAIGAAPAPYLWIYPSPLAQVVLDLYAYYWPMEMTDDTHGPSLPPQAETAYRELLFAFLLREQGKPAEFQAQLANAQAYAKASLSSFAIARPDWQREMWSMTGDGGGGGRRRRVVLAAGEPQYT